MPGLPASAAMADAVLLLHAAIALWIVLMLPLAWIGGAAGWGWVRNPWLRAAHLAGIACVALQALAGRICPLTTLEDRLRGLEDGRGFIERHVSALLYWDLPPAAFAALYTGFALLVALAWWQVPPRPFRRGRPGRGPAGQAATRSP